MRTCWDTKTLRPARTLFLTSVIIDLDSHLNLINIVTWLGEQWSVHSAYSCFMYTAVYGHLNTIEALSLIGVGSELQKSMLCEIISVMVGALIPELPSLLTPSSNLTESQVDSE